MSKKINIVTGPIRSGKTTRLFQFTSMQNSVDGILAPIVNSKRKLYHISSKSLKNFQVDEKNNNTILVGDYIFLNESFSWANNKLLQSFSKSPDWLIVDEVGKLELKGQGLDPAVKKIILEIYNSKTSLILVIRDYLLEKSLEYYNLTSKNYSILDL